MSAIFSKNENNDVFLFDGNEKIGKKFIFLEKEDVILQIQKKFMNFLMK